ncbi:hypothetical protein P171DRAFT_439096 [Karstenula rhodostoma CBS 690.94]|uniref:RRM domain-containing protein n=1 Tax=Karstenula rhodostoma CBS 690.94 TaxID=1392251 RepID=A0A9P4PW59_9PLEO|nr:hypothetical protein P171DRAFT_439096 [Karstenula rhodostoma CBS 690.94]
MLRDKKDGQVEETQLITYPDGIVQGWSQITCHPGSQAIKGRTEGVGVRFCKDCLQLPRSSAMHLWLVTSPSQPKDEVTGAHNPMKSNLDWGVFLTAGSVADAAPRVRQRATQLMRDENAMIYRQLDTTVLSAGDGGASAGAKEIIFSQLPKTWKEQDLETWLFHSNSLKVVEYDMQKNGSGGLIGMGTASFRTGNDAADAVDALNGQKLVFTGGETTAVVKINQAVIHGESWGARLAVPARQSKKKEKKKRKSIRDLSSYTPPGCTRRNRLLIRKAQCATPTNLLIEVCFLPYLCFPAYNICPVNL